MKRILILGIILVALLIAKTAITIANGGESELDKATKICQKLENVNVKEHTLGIYPPIAKLLTEQKTDYFIETTNFEKATANSCSVDSVYEDCQEILCEIPATICFKNNPFCFEGKIRITINKTDALDWIGD